MKANRSKGLTKITGISLLLLVLMGAVLFWTAPVKAATNSLTTCDEATLRQAVVTASSGDTISFDCGSNVTIYLNQVITIDKDLTIDGSGPQITLDGQHQTGIFQVNSGVTFTIKSLTITNGQADSAAGIYNNNGTLIVINSTFSNNYANGRHGGGGGIYNNGTLSVTNSTFSNNIGREGAGIKNQGISTVTNSIFSNNQGVAIFNGGGTITVLNSDFANNQGAIFNTGTVAVTNSTFSSNNLGGTIYNEGTLTVTNSTFSGNAAGGINNYSLTGGRVTVTNSTFSGNGTGIVSTKGSVELRNTILANNSPHNCSGSIIDQGYNLEYSGGNRNTCGFTNQALSSDPLLSPLVDNGGSTQTIALLGGSPAINAIPAASCTDLSNPPLAVTTDQRGITRPQGGNCDIGAYEFQPGIAATRLVFSTQPGVVAVGLPFRDQPLLLAQANNGFIGTGFNGPVTLQIKPGTGTTGAVLSGPVTVMAINGLVSFSGLSIDKVGTGYVLVASAGGLTGVESNPFDVASDCSLQALKTITNRGGNLDFKCPTDTTITLDSSLTVAKDLTLTNSGVGKLTISGASKYNNFLVNLGVQLTLNNLTLEGAYNSAIINQGTVTVTNSTFSNNQANAITNYSGNYNNEGVFYYANPKLMVTNSIFSNNWRGIDNFGGTVMVTTSTFNNQYAGGIFNEGLTVDGILSGNLTVTNSTFSGNSVDGGGGGGGIQNNGMLTVTNSTFSGNSATYGGGAISNYGTLTVTNSTFSGNTATDGGAIYNYFVTSGSVTVTNSTLSGNTAAYGSGIYNGIGTVELKNTIMANSSGNNCAGSITDDGYNLEYSGGNSNSCSFSNNAVSGDPLLAPLADNGGSTQTMALLPGSPAINAIPAAACAVSTDQRGVLRPQGANCNIGAFEQVPSIVSLDQFNRPNGSIGGNWQGNTGTGFFRIVGSALQVANSGYLYWKASFGPNQEAGYTFTRISSKATEHDLILKGDGGDPLLGTAHLIEVQYNPAKKEVSINTLAPGRGWFTHIKFSGITFGAGDRFRAKAYASGLVEVYQNDKFIGSFNVTTGPKAWPTTYASAGGKIGVWFIGNFLSSEARFDDFSGGNF